MTVLCEFDRSLIDQAFALAMSRMPKPVTPTDCGLCRELARPCIVHKGERDWPHVGAAPVVQP